MHTHINLIIDSGVSIPENMCFGVAMEHVKLGNLVARKGWNGNGQFVFARPEDKLSVDMIINVVKSLPPKVKSYYKRINAHTKNEEAAGQGPKDTYIKFSSYLCLKAVDESIINGWVPSQTDLQAEDWYVVDIKE